VEPTSDDEALHDTDVFGAEFGPTEVPIFPSHRDRAQVTLQMVGVHRYVWVGQKYFQARPSLAHIVERLGKRCGGPQAVILQAPVHPGKEGFNVRLAVRPSMSEPWNPPGCWKELLCGSPCTL
jgi:hypothetical protein